MTKRERSSQPDRPSLERSLDALLDAFSGGGPRPDGDPARWLPVAQVLTALTSAPESSELTGEARALAEFRARPYPVKRPGPVHHRGPGWVPWLRGPRPAVAAAAGAVLVGGLLAVAYAGHLPTAAQRLAHDTIDAPAAGQSGSAGPDPAASAGPASRLPTTAGRATSLSGHGSAQPDRRMSRHSPSGSPRHHRPSRSAPGKAGGGRSGPSPSASRPPHGIPAQSGSPSDSPTPVPTQQPSPSASTAPSAAATPSPSAAPSATRRPGRHHRPRTAGSQSPSP